MAEEVVLMKGNEAIAHAAIRCGADGYFGYPITPQSEVLETLAELKPWETTGMVVLQAESEVAAINMVYGGAGSGKMVLTSSSSPGVVCVVDKAYIHRNGQFRLRRITVGGYSLVVLVVACNFSVNLQIRVLIRLQQLEPCLTDKDIFQILIKLRCQRCIHILRLNREVGNRNGFHLIIIDRRTIKLIGNSTRNDYQR